MDQQELERQREENMLLKEEIARLKKDGENQLWSLQKTNEGIKILYKELDKKNQQLQRLDQLKSDFVSTVSHELRTPLAITREGLNLVIDQIPGPINEKQRKVLVTGKQNIDRLNKIIDDLLDISKIEAGKMELKRGFADIRKTLEDLIESYQTVAALKRIQLRAHLPQDKVLLYIDTGKIIQVMNNLLNNAYKFTPENGAIAVRMDIREGDVMISVQDTGPGINPQDMEKLFGKFQQFGRTHGPGLKGTGLGLAISKNLLELHGGSIWVQSEVGNGTTFHFTLPLYHKIREEFDQDFDQLLKKVEAEHQSLTLMILKLVDFKNEVFPESDDAVICVLDPLVEKLRQVVSRPGDRVLLYNQQFIYIVLAKTNRASTTIMAGWIRETILQSEFMYDKQTVYPVFQLGVAVFPAEAQDRLSLVKAAQDDLVRKKTALIVDDNPQILHYLQAALSKMGLEVRQAKDGKECLDRIAGKMPDLLVLDLLMPRMSGYEVYSRLKGQPETMHIPIILLTENPLNMNEAKLHGIDVASVVSKSEGREKLTGLVKRYI
jgi:signal transduction histidine kinase